MRTIIILILTLIISCDMNKNQLIEPKANKIEKILSKHGDDRLDEYYWLNKRDDEEVIKYLNEENDYRNEYMKDYKPIYCRKKGSLDSDEEILIDANLMSEGYEYFRVGTIEISPDNKTMAYSIDTVSRRIYTIYFMDLETREIIEKNIPNSSGSITWANDNKTIFYNSKDLETLRSDRVMRYKVGQSGTGEEVYFEDDETFSVFSYKTKTDKYIVIGSSAPLSQEYRILNADNPDGKFKIFQERVNGLEYSISHFKDKWYITTNKDCLLYTSPSPRD